MGDRYVIEPVGYVHSSRRTPDDDDWDNVESRIELDPARFSPDSLIGLDAFSHVEVIFLFHLVDENRVVRGARHPRGRADWPKVGIFAQRGKDRPNRIGVTIAKIERVEGARVTVSGLDAIDGAPVIDLKPVMRDFLPRGTLREPAWAGELMRGYWRKG